MVDQRTQMNIDSKETVAWQRIIVIATFPLNKDKLHILRYSSTSTEGLRLNIGMDLSIFSLIVHMVQNRLIQFYFAEYVFR